MALRCCLPWVDWQVDVIDARPHWGTVCDGALRCKRASSEPNIPKDVELARGPSDLEPSWYSEWKQTLAGPISHKIAQFCVQFQGPVEPIGRAAPAQYWRPFWLPFRSPFRIPKRSLKINFWYSFWVPKMVPFRITGVDRF